MEIKKIPNEIDTNILYKIYDNLRYVYPIEKTHFDFEDSHFVEKTSKCFEKIGRAHV